MDEEKDVTGTETTETQATETEQEQASQAEEATAEEAKEKEKEAGTEDPEEAKRRKQHNRDQYERRQERKRLHDLELENARLKGFQEGLARAGGKTEQTADTAEAEYLSKNPKPTAEAFDTNAEYVEALTDWKLGLRDFKQEQSTKTTQDQSRQTEFEKKLDTQRSKGEEKYEDFEELVSTAYFEPATMASIAESEKGEDIAYYLASNPDVLEKVSRLSPFLQAKEIGRIEAGLESGKLQIKQTTKAPPPPATVGGSRTSTKVDTTKPDADKLSTDDWMKAENARTAISRGKVGGWR